MNIPGREDEVKILDGLLTSRKPELLAIYGRRRVGKTFLIKKYFSSKKCTFLPLSGIENGTFLEQRSAVTREIERQFFEGAPLNVPKDWFGVFDLILRALSASPKNRPFVIFFDEFPWMNTPRSRLLEAFSYYWNQHFSSDERVKVVICGSLASWIIKNIVNDTGSLYGRVTCRLKLEPLNLAKTKQFLAHKGVQLNHQQILSIYLATGGIPLYLNQVRRGDSADRVIDEMCFQKNGLLVDELQEVFKSLFLKEKVYFDLVREIAKHRYGISKTDLLKRVAASPGGTLTSRLEELEACGFILSFLPFQHEGRGHYYRVVDEYTTFYFRWIEPNLRSIKRLSKRKGYWMEMYQSPEYKAWRGYAFESICYKHLDQISKALGLKSVDLPHSWRYNSKKKSSEKGAQIDLLFDRRDGTITVCEIKCTDEPFAMDKEFIKEFQRKLQLFQSKIGGDRQLFFVLISSSGVKKNLYSEEFLDGVVTLKELFLK